MSSFVLFSILRNLFYLIDTELIIELDEFDIIKVAGYQIVCFGFVQQDVVGSYSQQNTGLIHEGIGANKKIYPHFSTNLRTYKAVQILKAGSLHSGAVGRNHLGLRETGA